MGKGLIIKKFSNFFDLDTSVFFFILRCLNLQLLSFMMLDSFMTYFGLLVGLSENNFFLNFLINKLGFHKMILIKIFLDFCIFLIFDFCIFLIYNSYFLSKNKNKIIIIIFVLLIVLIFFYFIIFFINFYLIINFYGGI